MEDIHNILKHWSKEEPKYHKLKDYIESDLEEIFKENGIFVRITSRVKDSISLTKKIYKKNLSFEDYKLLSDKVGIRIMCRFRNEIPKINNILKTRYSIVKEENKSSLLKFDQQGYKSHHFDLKIKKKDNGFEELYGLICEIQVRTFCEDVWAELYHDIGYKGYTTLQDEPKRQLFCLGGLLEVADDVFAGINCNIHESDNLNVNILQQIIEPTGIIFFEEKTDREFTIMVLEQILPLLNETPAEFEIKFKTFVEKNMKKIKNILEKSMDKTIPFATQPELIIIFMLIEEDPFSLKETWGKNFPIKDLQKIAIWWGKPIDDILSYD